MLKNKYQRMSKKEKKQIKKEYTATVLGKKQMNRITRILIYGILCFLYSVYITFDNIKKGSSILVYIFAGIVLVASVIFIYNYFNLKINCLNNYALNNKRANHK